MKYQISLLFKQQHLVAIRRNCNVVVFFGFYGVCLCFQLLRLFLAVAAKGHKHITQTRPMGIASHQIELHTIRLRTNFKHQEGVK